MLSFSNGNLLLALATCSPSPHLSSALGLPVTASYIVLAVLAAPALQNEFGVPLIIAHLVIFWYSQDSNVTPPVALGRVCGGRHRQQRPDENRALRRGSSPKVSISFRSLWFLTQKSSWADLSSSSLGTWLRRLRRLGAFAAALEGYMFTKMYLVSRLLVTIGLVGIFWPNMWYEIIGFSLIIVVLVVNFFKMRQEEGEATSEPQVASSD